jgi:hypothetical protein
VMDLNSVQIILVNSSFCDAVACRSNSTAIILDNSLQSKG